MRSKSEMSGQVVSLQGNLPRSDRSPTIGETAAAAAYATRGDLALKLRRDISVPDYPELAQEVTRALDGLEATYHSAGPTIFGAALIDLLEALKNASSDEVWREVIMPTARAHRITPLVHECPFTSHSFTRPRGYPGDAGLLDFVYRHPDAAAKVDASTPTGRAIMDLTVGVSACEAVRQRKGILARKIDEVAAERPGAEILAVAAGHLREAEGSEALKNGKVARFVVTDQDQISLDRVEQYKNTISSAIDVRNLSVKHFISRRHLLGRFDLVYAAGLYDYLDARVAARLTRSLFSLLKPGGRLLVPNFLHGVKEEAYMEVYMDWYLLYRTRDEIEAFADEIPAEEIGHRDYFADKYGTIGYLELVKA